MFFCIIVLILMLFLFISSAKTTSIAVFLFSMLCFSILLFNFYIIAKDYFFTDIILTNKRIIIVRFNRPTSIDFSNIKSIFGVSRGSFFYRNLSYLTLRLKKIRFYNICFINCNEFKNKFKEVYPTYVDKQSKLPKIAFLIFIITFFAFVFVNIIKSLN